MDRTVGKVQQVIKDRDLMIVADEVNNSCIVDVNDVQHCDLLNEINLDDMEEDCIIG